VSAPFRNPPGFARGVGLIIALRLATCGGVPACRQGDGVVDVVSGPPTQIHMMSLRSCWIDRAPPRYGAGSFGERRKGERLRVPRVVVAPRRKTHSRSGAGVDYARSCRPAPGGVQRPLDDRHLRRANRWPVPPPPPNGNQDIAKLCPSRCCSCQPFFREKVLRTHNTRPEGERFSFRAWWPLDKNSPGEQRRS